MVYIMETKNPADLRTVIITVTYIRKVIVFWKES